MKELIKQLLREGLTPTANIYYSGSRRKDIQWGSAPEYHGYSIFGYGMYLTTNRFEAIEYALNKGNEVGYLHTIKLKNGNLVDISDKVNPSIVATVKSMPNIYKLFKTKSGQDLKSLNYWDVYGDEDGDYPNQGYTKENIFQDYNHLYFYLVLFFGSLKKTSLFFANELGVDGFITQGVGIDDVDLNAGDYILTLLNPNLIQKIKTTEVTEKNKQQNSYF
jgi:hypothetical protein